MIFFLINYNTSIVYIMLYYLLASQFEILIFHFPQNNSIIEVEFRIEVHLWL